MFFKGGRAMSSLVYTIHGYCYFCGWNDLRIDIYEGSRDEEPNDKQIQTMQASARVVLQKKHNQERRFCGNSITIS